MVILTTDYMYVTNDLIAPTSSSIEVRHDVKVVEV